VASRRTAEAELTADCSRCTGLCCVLLPFRARDGFAVDKDGGTACHNLEADDRCGVHDRLRASGWPGCTVFECFGAGQQVTQVTYGGRSWRELDDLGEMGAVLSVMRRLHEMRWLLREAADLVPGCGAVDLDTEVERTTRRTPTELLTFDVDDLHDRVGALLRRVSADLRSRESRLPASRSGQDLAGRDLRGHDLRNADLRGSVLIAADLRRVDLAAADLLGADLRDTDLRGTLLRDVLFLTQPQVASARGDAGTTLPRRISRPEHWPRG
jgi:Pentapeptide repeats (8 copies)